MYYVFYDLISLPVYIYTLVIAGFYVFSKQAHGLVHQAKVEKVAVSAMQSMLSFLLP